jgi:hypothetical protein
MVAEILATALFSLSAIFGQRVSRLLSGTQANLGRLGLAAILLGLWSHIFGYCKDTGCRWRCRIPFYPFY